MAKRLLKALQPKFAVINESSKPTSGEQPQHRRRRRIRMGKILDLTNVHSYYGHIHALKGVSLYVDEGEIVTLIGANGAGKSTTLRTISGLLHPKEGTVRLGDKDITHMEPHKIVGAGVGHVPEGRGIFPKLTVRENLDMGAFTVDDQTQNGERTEQIFSLDRKSTRLNSSHLVISYAVFSLRR